MLRRELLELLDMLETEEYRTAARLSEKLGISEKTVRLRLRELKEVLDENGAQIDSKARHGYRLEVTDKQKFAALSEQEVQQEIPDNGKDRMEYLMAYLIWQQDYVKSEDLCEFLYISKTTLTKALKQVEMVLKRYGLEVERKPNYGIRVVGREIDARRLICDYFVKKNSLQEMNSEHMEQELVSLAHYVRVLLDKYEIRLSEISFSNFVEYVYVSWRRIRYGHCIEMVIDEMPEIGKKERELIRELIDKMEEKDHFICSQDEANYLLLYLTGKRMVGNVVENESNFVIHEQMDRMALAMLDFIKQTYHMDFHNNFDVRMTLNQHLVPMDVRLRFDIPLKNPLLDEIKEKYSLAFQITSEAVQVLRDHYHKEVSEDEIGYLALILELAIEKERTDVKADILVVCSTGKSSSRLLKFKYEQEFSEYLDQIYVCDLIGLERFDFSKVQYIFTTVPITKEVPVPIVEVGAFLGEDDIRKVTEILRKGNPDYLQNYFGPRRFLPHMKASNKGEVLEQLCTLISCQEKVDDDFYDLVLERETYIQMDYGNLIAIPHPNRIASEESFAYVAVLEQPIHWNQSEVQVVILSSIGRKEDPNRQKFYEATARLALSESSIRKLIDAPSYQTLLDLLKNE